ncbi:MAG: DUF2171 domain-containing protein [Anaerolineae bacterium]|nr:DUF2171 domain-containing protein [Anaerolineae bacterium]
MQKGKTIWPDAAPIQKLLISGFITLAQECAPVSLQRGMSVLAQEGVIVGAVAAVVLNSGRQEITHFLLGQVPPTAVYRLIPLSLIDRIDGDMVWLRIPSEKISDLPLHQPDC